MSEVFHARINNGPMLTKLARINRRTANVEANIAVEKHLEANRELLKSGGKMPKRGPRLSR